MGIIDSVKKSISGSDDSGSSFNDSQYDSSFQSNSSSSQRDNPFSDGQENSPPASPEPQQGSRNTEGPGNDLQPPESGRERDPTPESPLEQGQGTGANRRQESSPLDSPNAQAGRPEQGGAMPQVSSNTQKEMENAGFDFNEGQQNQGRGGRDDLSEIKSQNEKIIDLLRSIERKLDSGEENFNQGRRTDRGGNSSGRHGGRR